MEKAEVLALYAEIRQLFPELTVQLDERPEHSDVAMDIPAQEGLRFDIGLYLSGDELHLVAGDGFWLEWFPGYEPDVKRAYLGAVQGLLSGRLRILEHRRGSEVLKAELQEPSERGWKTIGTWNRMALWLPFERRSQTILRNTDETPREPS